MRSFLNTKPTPKCRKPAPTVAPTYDHRAISARRLDLAADCLLQAGHHAAAELAAWRAMALREAGR